jgi:RNA polymerase sigma-70 factor, ECF subfamily
MWGRSAKRDTAERGTLVSLADTPAPPDLSPLVERIGQGDADAESALVAHFGPRIRALLTARTRNRDLAGDLAQETLIAVLQALRRGQVRDPGRIAAFVHGVARNLANNHHRARQEHPEAPLDEVVSRFVHEDDRDGEERQRLLRRALAGLGPQDREVLLLTLVHGLKPAQIADRLGLSAEVVRTRKTRALRRVTEEIDALSRPAPPDHFQ